MTVQETIIELFRSYPIPGMSQPATNPFVSVLEIHTFQDFLLATLYVGVFYYMIYFVIGGNYSFTQPSWNSPTQSLKALRG